MFGTNLAILSANQTRIIQFSMLNEVWNADKANLIDSESVNAEVLPMYTMNESTTERNGFKRIMIQSTPKILNMKWANAALLACTFPTNAAILAVIVVPMFSPNTSAAAISNGIHP